MIELIDVHKSFGSLEVLKGINLKIEEGEKLVIIGPSGSGKSTLIRCMNGLEEVTSGEVYINGISSPVSIALKLTGNIHLWCSSSSTCIRTLPF